MFSKPDFLVVLVQRGLVEMNINCPNCKKKLAENEDAMIHIQTRLKRGGNVQYVFDSATKPMAFTCSCGFIGQYDATGGIWITDITEIV